MHAMLNMALRAARAGTEALVQNVDRRDRISMITAADGSIVTSVERDAERTILHHLMKSYPDDGYVCRVSETVAGKSETIWIINPLLGSNNYMHGHPFFGLAIACQRRGVIEHGVVLFPLLSEEFWASRGAGAQLNSTRIRVGQQTDFQQTLVTVELEAPGISKMLPELLSRGAEPRCSGVAALDLLYCAADRLQAGCLTTDELDSCDASLLILKEAGGMISSEKGHPDLKSGKEMLFANVKLYKALLNLRQAVLAQDKKL